MIGGETFRSRKNPVRHFLGRGLHGKAYLVIKIVGTPGKVTFHLDIKHCKTGSFLAFIIGVQKLTDFYGNGLIIGRTDGVGCNIKPWQRNFFDDIRICSKAGFNSFLLSLNPLLLFF